MKPLQNVAARRRRAIARQWLSGGADTNRPEDEVVDGGEAWEVLFRLPDMIRVHSAAESVPVLVRPRDATAAGVTTCRSADVESSIGCDGRLRDDVPPSEPFGPDNIPGAAADADRDRDSWQVLLDDGRAHHRPRAIDCCRQLWRGCRRADRRHAGSLREERRLYLIEWMRNAANAAIRAAPPLRCAGPRSAAGSARSSRRRGPRQA